MLKALKYRVGKVEGGMKNESSSIPSPTGTLNG